VLSCPLVRFLSALEFAKNSLILAFEQLLYCVDSERSVCGDLFTVGSGFPLSLFTRPLVHFLSALEFIKNSLILAFEQLLYCVDSERSVCGDLFTVGSGFPLSLFTRPLVHFLSALEFIKNSLILAFEQLLYCVESERSVCGDLFTVGSGFPLSLSTRPLVLFLSALEFAKNSLILVFEQPHYCVDSERSVCGDFFYLFYTFGVEDYF
jgi:hypothetical protein